MKAWLLISSILIILFAGCGLWSRRVSIGEQFTLRPGDRVVVASTNLAIQLEGVGRQWYVDRRAEAPYASLIISPGSASPRPLTVSESISVDDYIITLKSANPFSHDGGPRCDLVVTHR